MLRCPLAAILCSTKLLARLSGWLADPSNPHGDRVMPHPESAEDWNCPARSIRFFGFASLEIRVILDDASKSTSTTAPSGIKA
jgi:hypothetical protein